MSGFLERLGTLAATQGHDTALRMDGARLTFADLPAQVIDRAARLGAAGLRAGSVVAVTIADDYEHMIVALALLSIGAWQINAASHDSAATRSDLAQRVGADVQLCDTPAADIPGLAVVRWMRGGPAGTAPAACPAGGGGAFFSTSGTTGRQSIVRLTEAQLIRQSERRHTRPGDRYFKAATMEYGHVKRNRLFALWCGSENVLRARDAGSLSAWLAQSGVTIADISRVNLTGLLAENATQLPATLALRAEGSAVPPDLRRAVLSRVTPNFYIRYAATETGLIAIAQPDQHGVEGALGQPRDDIEIGIVSDRGEPLPPGETGEIRLRSPGMASGYFDEPEKTALRFRDGWFLPGDMGRIDRDGQLVLVGRKDDMINLSGIKIFPIEVERVLAAHPDVRGVAVFPIDSKIHGQIPVAAIELGPDAIDRRDAILADLMRTARAELGLRAPRKLIACDTFPRNAMGKVVTRDLRSLFEKSR